MLLQCAKVEKKNETYKFLSPVGGIKIIDKFT